MIAIDNCQFELADDIALIAGADFAERHEVLVPRMVDQFFSICALV